MTADASRGWRASPVYLVVSVLLIASTLRAPITSVGPVIDRIGESTGLGTSALGLLGTLPLIAFAVVSPFVSRMARRWGAARVVLVALVTLVAATLLRSSPLGVGALWVGTLAIGAAIAVGNVLVPALVKRDFPREIPLMTGAYTTVLGGFAAIASGLAVPITVAYGWRVGIGCWALFGLLAIAAWAPRVGREDAGRQDVTAAEPNEPRSGASAVPSRLWTSRDAWWVTAFMGCQSLTFYVLVTWLPSIDVSYGASSVTAGWHQFGFQLVGVVAGFGITAFMRGRADQRLVAATASLGLAVGMLGLVLAPSFALAWILLAGASGGAAFVISLTLVAQRARTAYTAARLSGMAQGVGYTVAAVGPLLAGIVFDRAGTWMPVVVGVAAVAGVQLVVGLFAGRDRYVDEPTAEAPAVVA
ncbi:CynX/NimT family MFS transporter [Demequina salsinemoris]|uniref:CynX/NimT family MFS transporter n=1 Tax=Demequina salsinemoris TaxID=577470 RepID=UPI000783A8CA|nr:MFS transporter [Demequina salsinemoris]